VTFCAARIEGKYLESIWFSKKKKCVLTSERKAQVGNKNGSKQIVLSLHSLSLPCDLIRGARLSVEETREVSLDFI